MATLNAAVGDTLGEIASAIEARVKKGGDLEKAVMEVVREWVIETKDVRFEGNNYAEDWVVEAEKRGLPNLRKTPEALAQLTTKQAKELFTKSGVYTHDELEARYHLEIERFIKDLEIEIACLKEIAKTMVLPAAYKHQANLVSAVSGLSGIGLSGNLLAGQVAEVESVAKLISDLQSALAALDKAVEKAEGDDIEKKAAALAYSVSDQMAALRDICDNLETVVDDNLWPLPKYREMLFLC
jgi:glutamine synthetase